MRLTSDIILNPVSILSVFHIQLIIKSNQLYSLNIYFIHPLTFIRLQIHWYGHLSDLCQAIGITPHSSDSHLFNLPIDTAIREINHTIKLAVSLTYSQFFNCLHFHERWNLYSLYSMYCPIWSRPQYLPKHSKLLQAWNYVCYPCCLFCLEDIFPIFKRRQEKTFSG